MNVVATIAALALVAYAAVVAMLWAFQERIVFQPPPVWRTADDDIGDSRLSPGGSSPEAMVIGEWRPDRALVIAFHGNAVIARWLVPWAREVVRRFDAVVILPEYRGYDGAAGTPTYADVSVDGRAVLDAAAAAFSTRRDRFVLYGHSLGSGVASELARECGAGSLVLESPFTSARDLAARWPVPGLRALWPLISRVHYDTLAIVRTLDVPVFVAHGNRDIVIPVRMGRQVFAEAREPGRLLLVPKAGHSDLPTVGGDDYWRWLGAAIAARDAASR